MSQDKVALLKQLLEKQAQQKSEATELSYGQKALWFIHQSAPDSPAYNVGMAARIRSEVNIVAWKKACQRLVNRHPMLRTTYKMVEGQLRQQVHGFQEVHFEQVDVRGFEEEKLRDKVLENYERPFDLETGPVARFHIFTREAEDHILLINVHHIACDGFSVWVMLDELKDLYAAEVKGEKAELPKLDKTYLDFVRHQQDLLQNKKGEDLWGYWEKKLGGFLPNLELPTDHPRPPVQSQNGGTVSLDLNAELTEKLRHFSKEEGVTLFATLVSAFQTLLSRLSGQDDILIGTPTSGRDKAEYRPVVGYFVNPVVLRGDLSGDPTFREYLARNKSTVYGAIEHQDFPFPYLVEKLNIKRDKSRSPVFQTFFSLLKSGGDDAVQGLMASNGNGKTHDWGILKLEQYDLTDQEGQFDLTLALTESLGTISGKFKYNADLFEKETIERWVGHFQTLLEGIIENPDQKLSHLPLLTIKEKKLMVDEWNQTATPYPTDLCMHQLFEQRVDQDGERTALVVEGTAPNGGDETFSYSELEEKANRLANHLIALGVGPEQKIGICVHRSAEMVIGILGILKAGGAYVPLDPDWPSDRIAYMVEDAGMEIVLTCTNADDPVPDSVKKTLYLDKEWETIAKASADRPKTKVKPNHLAYIIYTSGSTGKPKGVLVEHGGVVNKLVNFKQDVTFGHEHRFTLLASYAFDASVGQMFMPLCTGSPLFLMPKSTQSDPEAFWDFYEKHQINVIYTVASLLGPMLDSPRDLSGLNIKFVFLGAELFPVKLLHKIRERLNVERIINMYGPTEATVNAIMHEVQEEPKGSIPLGKPLPNYRAYVLDRNLQLCPIGVHGEICIGGPAVTRGYLNQPELTADRFVPSPFVEGDVLYRSGDLAKYLPNGDFAFLGRIDKQVKVNGFRIEPGEVEAALHTHQTIKDALVMAREDSAGNQRLVAYLIPKNGEIPTDEIKQHLSAKLPSYMVPTAFVELEKFPTLPNGKVDTHNLPAPGASRSLKAEYVAPRNDVEQLLAKIWGEILGIERVGINDNFFDLGGASVQSIQVVNRANEFGFKLTGGMMFEYQTIAELAPVAAKDFVYQDPAESNLNKEEKGLDEEERKKLRPSLLTDHAGSKIDSIGSYLPPKAVTTEDLLSQSRTKIRFPLEKMTGIKSRRMAGDDEFAIDLARKAADEALSRSKYKPEEIELLVCCNISRYDGPFQVSYEPSTAMRLRRHFGMENAMVFDINNACATMWTGVNIVDAFIQAGVIKAGMVVSGEYITHLSKTAVHEIEQAFMDPRMACFTVGDSGAAVILEAKQPHEKTGFHGLEMFTLSEYCMNCVAKTTYGQHGGAIMYVESVRAAAEAIPPGALHSLNMIKRHNWLPEVKFDHLLMHQTSSTTIGDAAREINSLYGQRIANRDNVIDNIAHRGNTATTSHWVASLDQIREGRINSGDSIVFGISGSGHTVGAALYTFDDLPDRMRGPKHAWNHHEPIPYQPKVWPSALEQGRVSIESVGRVPETYKGKIDGIEFLKEATRDALAHSQYKKEELGLIMNTGVYRDEFLSEPAVAAILAGQLDINSEVPVDSPNRTFAMDILNGSMGWMNATYSAIQMLRSHKYSTALVTASEVENNREVRPDELLGIAETGSATILHKNADSEEGFGNFVFRTFPGHVDTRVTYSTWHEGEAFLKIMENPNQNQFYLKAIQETVEEFLQHESLTLNSIDHILPPQISPRFVEQMSELLEQPKEKFVDISGEKKDLFTSSVPLSIRHLKESGKVKSGDRALIVAVGAGIQVACALYHF